MRGQDCLATKRSTGVAQPSLQVLSTRKQRHQRVTSSVRLGRGLDVYQKPDGWFSIGANDTSLRKCLETKVDIFRSSAAPVVSPEKVMVRELKVAGADRVFKEKISCAITDRAGLRRALAPLEKGDALFVTRLDRLARSTRDLLNTLAAVAEALPSLNGS